MRAAPNASGERSGQIDNLTRLRSGSHSFKVGIFATIEFALSPFSGALRAPLFLIHLFLSTDPLSLAFFHAVPSALMTGVRRYIERRTWPLQYQHKS